MSRWLRAASIFAVVCAVVIAILGAGAAPAHAAGLIRVKINPASGSISAGDSKAFTVSVKNEGRRTAKGVNVAVSAPGLENTADVTVEGGSCDSAEGMTVKCGDFPRKKEKTFTITVTGKADAGLDDGEKSSGSIKAAVTSPNSTSGSASVTIVGVKQVTPGVSGTVTDLDGEPLPEVAVTATDADGKKGTATTDAQGKFNITKEFAAGEITLKYELEGYETAENTATAKVGTPVDTSIRLTEVTKDDGATKKAEPTEEDDALPSTDEIDATTWILMALGVLLLLGGIVAIVMVLRKRDKDDGDDEPSAADLAPSIYKPNATQTGDLGVYDAAQRRPGMDAQTMLHNGPLYTDDDMAKPGSTEPASQAGFGPSYTERPSDDATMRRPQSLDELPPASYGTQPYSSPRDGYESGDSSRGYGTSGFGRSYGEREQSASPSAPSEHSGYPSQGSEPAGFGRGYEDGADRSGGYGSDSGYGRGYGEQQPPAYPSQTSGYGRSYGSDSGYGGGYGSDSGYGRGYSEQQPPTYPSQTSGYGRSYGSDSGYGGGYGSDSGYGRGYSDRDQYSSEQPPQPPRQSRPRHYREDDDDQPRSW